MATGPGSAALRLLAALALVAAAAAGEFGGHQPLGADAFEEDRANPVECAHDALATGRHGSDYRSLLEMQMHGERGARDPVLPHGPAVKLYHLSSCIGINSCQLLVSMWPLLWVGTQGGTR